MTNVSKYLDRRLFLGYVHNERYGEYGSILLKAGSDPFIIV